MLKSTIQFLLINLSALILISCGSNNVVLNYTSINVEKEKFENPYFSNPAIDYVYKANISVYGNNLSGIFIAKKISETTHRVVFTTEFGNKLLDFEISENDFKINSIVSELNKNILINTLKTDFRLLLKKQFAIKEQFEDATKTILKSLTGNRINFILISKNDHKMTNIIHASNKKQKININFISENNTFAQKIIIQHYNINLKIELNYLENKIN